MVVSEWLALVTEAINSHPEREGEINKLNRQVLSQCIEYGRLQQKQAIEPTNVFKPLNATLHIARFLKDKPQALNDILIQGDPQKQMKSQKKEVFAPTQEVKKLIAERKQREAETVGDKYKQQSIDVTGKVSETHKDRIKREFTEQFKMKRAKSRSREKGDLEH
jgi:hypothetical protein